MKNINQLLRECLLRVDRREGKRSAVAERELAKIKAMLAEMRESA